MFKFKTCQYWIALFAANLFVFAADEGHACADDNENERPNIVFFLTDDQAKISLGCYSEFDEVKTPNIDRLASRGVVFDRHYVTTAICMASRASIMTGLYEYRHGCNFGNGRLSADHWRISYPMMLRESGYRTAFAGKFGFEIEGRERLPAKDFDSWGGGPGQTHYRTAKNESMQKYADRYPHATRAYGAFGQDFIRDSVVAKQPFCLSASSLLTVRFNQTPSSTTSIATQSSRNQKTMDVKTESTLHHKVGLDVSFQDLKVGATRIDMTT